jgi:hypothetical protein
MYFKGFIEKNDDGKYFGIIEFMDSIEFLAEDEDRIAAITLNPQSTEHFGEDVKNAIEVHQIWLNNKK